MSDINKVILIGRLTRDSEFKQLTNTTVCNFSLAVNRRIKASEGNWADEVSYFDVELYGKLGEAIKSYLTKGKQIGVEGMLRQQRWETSDGQKRSRVVITANNVQLLGGGGAGANTAGGADSMPSGNASSSYGDMEQGRSQKPQGAAPQDFDDDIPF